MNRTLIARLPLFTISALALISCGEQNQYMAPPPPQVEVGKPIIEDTRVFVMFPGRAESTAKVEVRARVKGFLQSRKFQAGDYVEKGTVLFTIEPEQFEAAVNSSKGSLARAEADLAIATTDYKKKKAAFEKSAAVAELDVLSAEADMKAKAANVDIEKANLANAERDLTYTTVRAPISGRVSRSLVDQGNLVGANEPTLLTTVVESRPIYINFEASERAAVRHLSGLPDAENPEMKPKKPEDSELELVLADGTIHTVTQEDGTKVPELGRVEFVDNVVSSQTGTIKIRAQFDNTAGNLVDGAFVRIRFPRKIEGAVKVLKDLVQRDLGGNFVLVVGDGNIVERRVVIPTEYYLDDYRIIESYDEVKNTGLKADDVLITSNLQRARPGLEVIPKQPGEHQPPPENSDTSPEQGKGKAKAKGKSKASVEQ